MANEERPRLSQDFLVAGYVRGEGARERRIRLTRLDQAWWPALGIVKADAVEYYRRIAAVLVPHLRDRPFTMKRHFNGPRSPFEWVKDAPPELPDWIPVSPQPAKSRGGELVRYPLVNDELALLWMVEFGCVDLHVWTSRADRPDRPEVVLFDLDPAGVAFAEVAQAALLLRDALTRSASTATRWRRAAKACTSGCRSRGAIPTRRRAS